MWHLTTKIPDTVSVAVSGGADSMALLHFVCQAPRRSVTALMFDHGTGAHDQAKPIVGALCERLNVPLIEGCIQTVRAPGQSPEEHWRDERYAWLHAQPGIILTGHNLDDVCETWLWGAVNGQTKLMPQTRGNVWRPLLAVEKAELEAYCEKHGIPVWQDPSNGDTRYARVRTRQTLLPAAVHVNPGFKNMLRRRLLERPKEGVDRFPTVC